MLEKFFHDSSGGTSKSEVTTVNIEPAMYRIEYAPKVVPIKFKKLDTSAIIPKYAHESDSGMDVSSVENVQILPRSFAKIRTGLAAVIPDGYEIQVRPRSGLQSKYGIVGAFGTVDSGYRGDIGVTLYNHSDDVFNVHKGDRIAQLVLAPVVRADISETTEELDDTDRGANGFGSTGV